MAVHRDGTLIQSEAFNSSTPSSSSLWTAYATDLVDWTYPQTGTGTSPRQWQTNGELLLPDLDIQSTMTATGPEPSWTEYRGTQTNFDPKSGLHDPLVSISQISPLWYGTTIRIKAPSTFPTDAGEAVEVGATIVGGNAADDQTALMVSWEYDATAATQSLNLYRCTFDSDGHRTERALLASRSLSAIGQAISAGAYAVMTIEVQATAATNYWTRIYWDDSGIGNPSYAGSLTGASVPFDLNTQEGFCGVFLRQDGPHSVPPPSYSGNAQQVHLTAPAAIDWFQVEDLRPIAADPLFPEPQIAAAPTLSSVVLSGEANATTPASSLTLQPSFAIPLAYSIESRDFRTTDGTLISSPVTAATRRTWEMRWEGLTAAQRNTLDTLWHSTQSGIHTFTWTHPQTDEVVTLRTIGRLSVVELEKNVYGATAVAQEVL